MTLTKILYISELIIDYLVAIKERICIIVYIKEPVEQVTVRYLVIINITENHKIVYHMTHYMFELLVPF